MRLLGKIAYWLAALTLLSAILVSLDYSLVQAVLISLIFCPCALALEYLMPKARKPMDKVYLSLAVLVAVIVLILFLHYSVWSGINQFGSQDTKNVAPMLINPAFLGLILTVLSIGDYYWSKWLDRRYKAQDRTVTFFSERKASLTSPMWSLTTPRSVSSRPPATPIATKPASPSGKTCWTTVFYASTAPSSSMWLHPSFLRPILFPLPGRNCPFPGNTRKMSKRSWPLHRMLARSLPQVTKTFENVPSGVLEHSGGNNMGLFCYLRRAASQILLLFPREVPV